MIRRYRMFPPDDITTIDDPDAWLAPLLAGGGRAEHRLRTEFRRRGMLPLPRVPRNAAKRLRRALRRDRQEETS